MNQIACLKFFLIVHNEVTGFRENQWAAKGVKIRNPSFDVTPAELVTALITEKGIIYNPNKENLFNFLNK